MQPSNRGSYLPVDTQDHAVSGRASSMPRLTVDPQVKPSRAPMGAGSKQSLSGNTGASLCTEQVPRAPQLLQHPNIEASPHLWGAAHVGELLSPYIGDSGSREQPAELIPWLMWEVRGGARFQGLPAVGHHSFPSAPGTG